MVIWKYWGKAIPRANDVPAHAFIYHCLDVVAVADAWLAQSAPLRRRFESMLPWLRFFIALHDLGKLFVSFQVKSIVAIHALGNYSQVDARILDSEGAAHYQHGPAGFVWLKRELGTISGSRDNGDPHAQWDRWSAWMGAVAGHHGAICVGQELPRYRLIEPDAAARSEWVRLAAKIFLEPHGLSLRDDPPIINSELQSFIAGFCAICDWLGSNECFTYCIEPTDDLHGYLERQRAPARQILIQSGIVREALREGGIATALAGDQQPHQIQRYIDDLPLSGGLTLVEAPTGSGKTEAALGLAARLLAAGLAESIVFALPTQATANAMLPRLEMIAPRLFPGSDSSLVLAHGRAAFNADAIRLRSTVHDGNEATVHQADWLSQSRKRVFLGQIGVCTIDQVLLSVLPVRHHFVRSFSLGRSVLIIDEVHAYDAYMYGLLERVLQQQRATGGSAILLSATLPLHQRRTLIRAWNSALDVSPVNDYPLLTQVGDVVLPPVASQPEDRPPLRSVRVESHRSDDVLPGDALIADLLTAADAGARIAVIVNLVADAQRLARRLRALTGHPVDIFHARFRFRDRMQRERDVLACYGKGVARSGGHILVATQVVEQSLDLDFDWLITQLCPADLLFQRIGRLHRHADVIRPPGFESPRCTVLLRSDGDDDYGGHGVVYGDQRALWRTEQRLLDTVGASGVIEFPAAYRDWVEAVYREGEDDLPGWVGAAYRMFYGKAQAARQTAMRISRERIELNDDDATIIALTRDGERSLNVLPVLGSGADETLLDGRRLDDLGKLERREALMLETINAPASWASALPAADEEGVIHLALVAADEPGKWELSTPRGTIRYTIDYGLEKDAR